jgi:hypothetical protein
VRNNIYNEKSEENYFRYGMIYLKFLKLNFKKLEPKKYLGTIFKPISID